MSFLSNVKKNWLVAVAVAFATMSVLMSMALAPVAATYPVAYVTPKRIFAETNEGKAGVARVQALQQQRQTELRAKQQALEATRQQMAKTSALATRLQLQQQELQQKTELERAVVQSQNDVLTLQRQVEADLQVKVRTLLGDVVKGRNVAVVLNEDSAILWASPSVDFTDAVIERLNAKPPDKR